VKKFLPAIFANLSATLSEILLMASSAWLIVSASLQPPLSALTVGITLVRTAGISRAALRYADRFFAHKTIFKFLDDLREKIFLTAAEKLPLKSGKIFEGELLHKLTVTADLQKDFLPRVILPISTAFFVTIFLSILLKSFLPAIIFFADLLFANFFSVKTADDSIYREKILDFYEGRDELKIFGTAPAIKILNQSAENFSSAQENIFNRQTNFDTLIKIFNAAGIFFILQGLETDRIYFAVWIFILLAAFEIYLQIPSAVRTYKKILSQKISTEKNLVRNVKSTSKNFAVEFKNVSFSYDDKNFVLENFNLQIERGEQLAIIGESGSGKTTLLYLMTGLFQPTCGEIFIGDSICATTFDSYIFSSSIRDNFKIFCGDISEEEIFAVLKICQLENFDIDFEIGENGNFLSGGERVRLQIALALAKNTEILILDEPTAGLDKFRAENLIEAVINFCAKKNRTLLIITHDQNISKKFTKIISLN